MDDNKIIDLYWARDEDAIRETSSKYGKMCFSIANNILANWDDSEECVNDTYLGAWNAIPPHRPLRFRVFIGRITRNIALKKFEYASAKKRNADAVCSLEELGECVSGNEDLGDEVENKHIERAISEFLNRQSKEKRLVFILRYWYFEPISSICKHTGSSQSKIKSMLHSTRKSLRAHLEMEGFEL